MIPEDVEALVLADATGALDANERQALARRIEALSWTMRAQIAELYDLTVILAESVFLVNPPAAVRDRLLAATTPGARPHEGNL